MTNTPSGSGSVLLAMLQSSQDFTRLPLPKKEALSRLAAIFEDNDFALYLTPTELTDKLSIGNRALWGEFLNLEPVNNYVKSQIASLVRVNTRKSIPSLAREAQSGNVQAAKELNTLAGIYNNADNNKIVVLHQINRRQQQEQQEQQDRH